VELIIIFLILNIVSVWRLRLMGFTYKFVSSTLIFGNILLLLLYTYKYGFSIGLTICAIIVIVFYSIFYVKE
jgi:hypothetical protein